MRQFTVAAATVAIAALISAAPASAEHNGGGPIQQNGQCWKASKGSDQMFGHWRACGEKACAEAKREVRHHVVAACTDRCFLLEVGLA